MSQKLMRLLEIGEKTYDDDMSVDLIDRSIEENRISMQAENFLNIKNYVFGRGKMVKCQDCKYSSAMPQLGMDFAFCSILKRPMPSNIEIRDCYNFRSK